ncbi:MAG: nucleoside hydrolase [Gammaproteobacteria bacterium]|nr:nucleoside hydrolase [Gammaproteobacteria bacterium]
MTRKIIIDCDPGQDDAVALLLAFAANSELEVVGVTTVAGNVPLELTERNARLMCDIAGRDDVDVYAGCSRPLVRSLITAEKVHGRTGIDPLQIRQPSRPLKSQHAVDFIVDSLLSTEDGPITLVPTGPLTNIAMAIVKEPAILDAVDKIVLMGGAMREAGNHSPSAEFNMLVDPHAAHVVFECGTPIIAMGLDVTHQVLSTPDRIERIRALGSEAAVATADMLEFYNRHDMEKYGMHGGPLHDPCTVAWLLKPELFKSKRCNVAVETTSELTAGHTAVDFWGISGRPENAEWVYEADAAGFYDLLVEYLERYSR